MLDPQAACYAFLNHAGEFVFSNETMARRLRGVSYARRLKTWARRVSGMPTFYVLGQPHAQSSVVLKFLRWLAALARGARHVPVDTGQ